MVAQNVQQKRNDSPYFLIKSVTFFQRIVIFHFLLTLVHVCEILFVCSSQISRQFRQLRHNLKQNPSCLIFFTTVISNQLIRFPYTLHQVQVHEK